MSSFVLPEATVAEATLDSSFDCEVAAGELPTRALSGALIFQASGDTLTLCDLDVLDGKPPTPVDVVGRLTKIDPVMDPVPGAELGPNVRLSGVTEWSVEYDALTATVWVSTTTADYKLVSAGPAYGPLWDTLEQKTLLSARCIALCTESKNLTFGQLRQHVVGLNSVEGNVELEFGSDQLVKYGGFIADQVAGSEGLARCKALQGMRQEIRRLTAAPTSAALEKAREREAARAEKAAEKEAAAAEKARLKNEKEAEKQVKVEAERQRRAEREARDKVQREEMQKQRHEQEKAHKAAQQAGGSTAGSKRGAPADKPPQPPLEKKRTKFETYATATSNVQQRPLDENDRYQKQRIVLDAPHVLPPGAICWTRQLKGEFKQQSKKVGMILGHDGTDEDGIYYHIKIHEDGEIIRLAFTNLMQRVEVTLTALQGRADLNGCKGYIEGAVEEKGRYSIKVQQMGKKDEWVNVKPANAILPPPTRVRLAGLVQASQYNGRIVKIVNVDQEAGRYEVTMYEDEDTKLIPKVLRLKYENALLW